MTRELVVQSTHAIDESLLKLAGRLLELQSGANQPTLLAFLRSHGTGPHLQNTPFWDQLTSGAKEEAQRYAVQTATFAFRASSGLLEIMNGLSHRGIRGLTFKGVAWSKMIYGDLISRPFGDLDILVCPDDLDAVHAYLTEKGFNKTYPRDLTPGQEFALRRFSKAQNYAHPTLGNLDLHWRLFSQWIGHDIPFEELWQRRVEVPLESLGAVPSFGVEDCLVFTSLHAAQDGWRHLKSLVDLSLLLLHLNPDWMKATAIAGPRAPLLQQAVSFAVQLMQAPAPKSWTPLQPGRDSALTSFLGLATAKTPPMSRLLHKELWSLNPVLKLMKTIDALLTPSVSDITTTSFPPRLVELYRLVRAFRLVEKAIARRSNRSLAKSSH